MVDAQLTCNYASCRKILNKQASVTSCSHIFCSEHLQDMVGKDTRNACLACGTQFQNEIDCIQVDLNPNEQYKMMVLMGLNPDQIMEIANRAISFFVYQLHYTNRNKDNTLKHMKEANEELKHYCTSLTAKFNADLQKEQRKAENLKHELNEKIRKLEIQQHQIVQSKKENKKLQMLFESQKREIINMRTAPSSAPLSHPGIISNFQPRSQIPFNFHPLHRSNNNHQNGAFGSSAAFVSPFKSYGTYSF